MAPPAEKGLPGKTPQNDHGARDFQNTASAQRNMRRCKRQDRNEFSASSFIKSPHFTHCSPTQKTRLFRIDGTVFQNLSGLRTVSETAHFKRCLRLGQLSSRLPGKKPEIKRKNDRHRSQATPKPPDGPATTLAEQNENPTPHTAGCCGLLRNIGNTPRHAVKHSVARSQVGKIMRVLNSQPLPPLL